jgi:chromosome segregation ATPase
VKNQVTEHYQLIMNDLAPSITDLKGKIEKLVKLHQQLKQDNDTLNAEKADLLKTIEGQKVEIEGLQKINQELKEKNSDEQNTIITDTKLKINELVQEIDDCIALLK